MQEIIIKSSYTLTEAITPIFNYNFTGNIWKIYFDKIKNLLILEIRNADIFQTSFACIDLNINTLVFEDLKMSQNWWLGISEVQDGIIFFHFFPDSQKPEAKEILAFDIFKQRPLWHSAIHRFEQLTTDYLLAWRWQEGEKIYEKLDLQTGKILDSPPKPPSPQRGDFSDSLSFGEG